MTATQKLAQTEERIAQLKQKLEESRATLSAFKQARAEAMLADDQKKVAHLRSQSVALVQEIEDHEAVVRAVEESLPKVRAEAQLEREAQAREAIARVEERRAEALARVEKLAGEVGRAVSDARDADREVGRLGQSIGLSAPGVSADGVALAILVRSGAVDPSALRVSVGVLRRLDPVEQADRARHEREQREAQAAHDRQVTFGPENVRRAVEARMDTLVDLVRAWRSHRHPSTRSRISEVTEDLRPWIERLPADQVEAARDELADLLAEATEPVRAIGA